MRGSRQLNHALHMAAVTQVRHRHSEGRAYYDESRRGQDRQRGPPGAQAPHQRRSFCRHGRRRPAVRELAQVAREGKRGTAQ